jgi:hypothetical protein
LVGCGRRQLALKRFDGLECAIAISVHFEMIQTAVHTIDEAAVWLAATLSVKGDDCEHRFVIGLPFVTLPIPVGVLFDAGEDAFGEVLDAIDLAIASG